MSLLLLCSILCLCWWGVVVAKWWSRRLVGLGSLSLSHDLTKEGGETYGLSDSPLHAVRDALAMRTCSSNLGGAEESYQQAVDSNKTHRYRAQ